MEKMSVDKEVDKTREGMKTLEVESSQEGAGPTNKASGGSTGGGTSGGGTEEVREELRRLGGGLVMTEGKEEGSVKYKKRKGKWKGYFGMFDFYFEGIGSSFPIFN